MAGSDGGAGLETQIQDQTPHPGAGLRWVRVPSPGFWGLSGPPAPSDEDVPALDFFFFFFKIIFRGRDRRRNGFIAAAPELNVAS